MHIVHLMASPFLGGPERQVLGLATHLPPPYRTSFLCFAERGLSRPFLEEARRLGFEARQLVRNAPCVRACIAEVAAELKRLRADVLCCSGYKPDLIGWRAARRAGVPVVSISHGWTGATSRVRLYELLDRLSLRFLDAVVCVSEAQAVKVRKAWVPEEKVVVIPNAIGDEAFAPPDPAYRAKLFGLFEVPPRLVVGSAGRFSPEKNFTLLVDAAAHVARDVPDAGFVLFGEGPLRPQLEQRIAQLGLTQRFVLAGFRDDLAKWLPHLDLAVMSSTTEGLPVFLLEAFAAGVPMVATAVGGIPEVLEDGRSGVLVRSGDLAGLAAGMARLLGDDATRRAMGEQGRKRVRAEFSFTRQSGRYQELFARVVNDRTH